MQKNLLIAILLMIYSTYLVVNGWLYYKQEKDVLDIFSLPTYWWLKVSKGIEEAEKWKIVLFQTRNLKYTGKFFIAVGIFGLVLAIFIGFY